MDTIQVTFRNRVTGADIQTIYLHQIPRVGDEVDLEFTCYWRVARVLWVYNGAASVIISLESVG